MSIERPHTGTVIQYIGGRARIVYVQGLQPNVNIGA
jgi:hypothetical protein